MKKFMNPEIEIISNTADVQAVRKPSANLSFYVFHTAGAFDGIEVSAPCIVAVKRDGEKCILTVCEPTQKLDEVTVKLGEKLEYVDGDIQASAECKDVTEVKINFHRAFGESFSAEFKS